MSQYEVIRHSATSKKPLALFNASYSPAFSPGHDNVFNEGNLAYVSDDQGTGAASFTNARGNSLRASVTIDFYYGKMKARNYGGERTASIQNLKTLIMDSVRTYLINFDSEYEITDAVAAQAAARIWAARTDWNNKIAKRKKGNDGYDSYSNSNTRPNGKNEKNRSVRYPVSRTPNVTGFGYGVRRRPMN